MEIPKSKSANDWFAGSDSVPKPKRPKRSKRSGKETAEIFEANKLGDYRKSGDVTGNPKTLSERTARKPGKKPKIQLDALIDDSLPEPDLEALEAALKPQVESESESEAPAQTDDLSKAPEAKTEAPVDAKPEPAPAQKAEAKPEPKPEKKYYGKRKPALDPAQQSAALAQTMVGSFVVRLKSECEKKGGILNLQDIEGLSKEFERKTGMLQKAFQASFEETIRARENVIINDKRHDAFERLMANSIAPLLANDDEKPKAGKTMSRRVLPGFFLALDKMLGDEPIDTFRRDMQGVVEQIQEDNGPAFDWDDVYSSVEAQNIALKAQITAAHHFLNLKQRRDWLVNLINDHLGPVTASMHKSHTNWAFSNRDFRTFTLAFFKIMSDTLATEGGRLRITRMYGVETIVVLADLLQALHKKAGS